MIKVHKTNHTPRKRKINNYPITTNHCNHHHTGHVNIDIEKSWYLNELLLLVPPFTNSIFFKKILASLLITVNHLFFYLSVTLLSLY